jgi:hypothetical protein
MSAERIFLLLKLDAAGNPIWGKSAGGLNSDTPEGLATDAIGNVFLAGDFYSPTLTFGSHTLTNSGPGYRDILVVKYDGIGNEVWAKSAGGSGTDLSRSIAFGGNGKFLCHR